MLDKIKGRAMQQGMKLLTNPRVMKLMADPRFMNALVKGLEFKGRFQSDVEARLRSVAETLNLATKDDVASLEQTLRQVEERYTDLEAKISDKSAPEDSA